MHSNVGGSCHPDGLANEALHWIVGKAEEAGLEFSGAFLEHYRPCFDSTLNDSMTAMYRVLGPIERPLGDGDFLASANTLIYMGKLRGQGRLERGLFIAKHRGSACSDEIVRYTIDDRGLKIA